MTAGPIIACMEPRERCRAVKEELEQTRQLLERYKAKWQGAESEIGNLRSALDQWIAQAKEIKSDDHLAH